MINPLLYDSIIADKIIVPFRIFYNTIYTGILQSRDFIVSYFRSGVVQTPEQNTVVMPQIEWNPEQNVPENEQQITEL